MFKNITQIILKTLFQNRPFEMLEHKQLQTNFKDHCSQKC